MAKILFTCSEVDLTHSQMLELKNAGLLNLGIDDNISARIAYAKRTASKKTAASTAFHFWNWVGIAVFLFSILLSFTISWWWFIPGFVGMHIIWQANKLGNSQNLLDAALIDEEFYERVRTIGAWLYQIDDSAVETFKIPIKSILSPRSKKFVATFSA